MPFEGVASVPAADKIRGLVGSFESAGRCFDERRKVIIDTFGEEKLRKSPVARYKCLKALCADTFGVQSPNVKGFMNMRDYRAGSQRLAAMALRSYTGFRTAANMLSCNGGC